MERKILKLPESVINKIAAGEVVENPASIVKELIENSLDAMATRISVEIVQGGQQLISVEDNGLGMGPDDAVACLERHATSKIREVEDLDLLATMGFRGEALAAIASVSHLEIKTSDGRDATRILAEGGLVKEIEPCARNQGTTIDVRFLFYNVPARKKFQKSVNHSTSAVRKVVETISLAHPEIAFVLKIGGKVALDLPMASRKKRIEQLLGEYAHEVKAGDLTGFVAAPDQASATRNGQYLFINKRPIFSPLIARAVKEAFGTRIAENAYPPFVLFLEVASDRVDVNVHPQKKEVRFQEESAIFRQVQRGVEEVFAQPAVFYETPVFTMPTTFAESLSFPAFKVEAPLELAIDFSFRPLAVFGNYFVLEKGRLIVADLKAMHARILFEQIRYEKAEAQTLIWPLEMKMEEHESVEELGALGIECRVLKKILVIDALPPYLDAAHFPLFLEEWRASKKIETAAARYTRAMKKSYLLHEAEALFRQLQKCKDVHYDPLGHPIWIELKDEDFEALLKRKTV